jgi:hypothetical protein
MHRLPAKRVPDRVVATIALLVTGFLFDSVALPSDSRLSFLPRLQSGQSLFYEVHGRVDRKVKTESRVVSAARGPQSLQGDLANQILLTIQEVRPAKPRPFVSVQANLLPAEGTPNPRASIPVSKLAFDILGDGQLGRISGFDDLSPEQRLLWQFWVARFAFAWTLPPAAVKPGAKWKLEEPELSDSLISGLVWEREVTYAHNDACPVFPGETCAVFLIESSLKQKSSTKDSTPDDYRLHGLKTYGTAKGFNQVITYISLKTGLVLRANEDLRQTMDVTVMKADGTNGVHYTIDADSHFETLFVAPSASPAR